MTSIQEKAAGIRLLAMDVDGVLTDGSLYFGNNGEELKAFNIRDGLGIKWLEQNGIITAIITGRISQLVQNRADNLGIRHVVQGREDKLIALRELCEKLAVPLAQAAYIGDDVQDLSAIAGAGLGCTVANGDPLVRHYADWYSDCQGGAGAVRELAELILDAQDKLHSVHQRYLP